jgi:hypothetical protein
VTFYHDSVLGKKNWVRSLVVLVLVLVGVDVGASGRGCCLIIYNTKEKLAGALCAEREGEERKNVLYMCTARICGQNDKYLPTT